MKKELSEILKLSSLGNYKKALNLAEDLFLKNKDSLNVIKVLTNIYSLMENFKFAASVMEEFINDNEHADYECYNNLGMFLRKTEDYKKSLYFLDKALSINSDLPYAYLNLAEINIVLRKFELAERHIDKSLSLAEKMEPLNKGLLINIIHLKLSINIALKKNKNSVDLLNKYLNQDFDENLFYEKTSIDPSSISESEINQAKKQLIHFDNTLKVKIHRFEKIIPLLYGVAKYYEKKNQDESETYYNLANREVLNILRYNSHDDQKTISNIIEIYNTFFAGYPSNNKDFGANNIFVIGTPRSGTTLTESIISANKEVFGGGEMASLPELLKGYLINNFQDKNLNIQNTVKIVQEEYLARTDFIKQDFSKIVDKLPGNFLYLGFILKMFPSSKVIRIFRDPWDTAISLYKQRYVLNIPYSSSFFNIGVFMANFEAINTFWDSVIQSKSVLDIKYEDLVKNQIDIQKKIYDFLKIESAFDEDKRGAFFAKTASTHQVQKKVYDTSVNKSEFEEKKPVFFNAFKSQRAYWEGKGIKLKSSFFGYNIDS